MKDGGRNYFEFIDHNNQSTEKSDATSIENLVMLVTPPTHTCDFKKTGKLLSWQHSATGKVNGLKKKRLLHIDDKILIVAYKYHYYLLLIQIDLKELLNYCKQVTRMLSKSITRNN